MGDVTKEELLDMVARMYWQLRECDNVGWIDGNAEVERSASVLIKRAKQETCNHYYQHVCELHNGDAQYECFYCGHRVISKGAP